MTIAYEAEIVSLAGRQHGIVTRSQLLAAGWTPRMVDSRVASRHLVPLHRGVYRLGHLRGPLEPRWSREMAAVLACGPGAFLSHRSAAWVWELWRRSRHTPVDITVPSRSRPRRPGIRVRRSSETGTRDITIRHGLPLTTPARTIRDLSAVIGTPALGRVLARAERRGLIEPDEREAMLARHAGRPGAPALRAVLESGQPRFTRSEAEDRFLQLVQKGDLPLPEANVMVRGYEVDFLWRSAGLAVEVDGFGFHASRHSFENDRRRDAELAANGIHVMRVTWRHVVEESHATLVRVAQALARS